MKFDLPDTPPSCPKVYLFGIKKDFMYMSAFEASIYIAKFLFGSTILIYLGFIWNLMTTGPNLADNFFCLYMYFVFTKLRELFGKDVDHISIIGVVIFLLYTWIYVLFPRYSIILEITNGLSVNYFEIRPISWYTWVFIVAQIGMVVYAKKHVLPIVKKFRRELQLYEDLLDMVEETDASDDEQEENDEYEMITNAQ